MAKTIAQLLNLAKTNPQSLTVSEMAQAKRLKAMKQAEKKATGKTAAKASSTKPHGAYVVDCEDLAAILEPLVGQKVDQRTIQKWVKAGGMPKVGPNEYPLGESIAWWVKNRFKPDTKTADDAYRLLKAQADEREQKAIQARVTAEKMEASVLDRTMVEAEWLGRIYAVKQAMVYLAIKAREVMVGIDTPDAAQKAMQRLTHGVLERFARGDASRKESTEGASELVAVIAEQQRQEIEEKR